MIIDNKKKAGEKLSFSYSKTNTIIYSHYKDGKWGALESRTDDNISISALSGSLHYGIQAFEGLKAYRGADGCIRLFRPWDNGARLKRSADYLGIASPDTETFIEACKRVVLENEEYIPSYESRGTLYIRPLLDRNPIWRRERQIQLVYGYKIVE
jgi:branched-chain amino acid aminotransferase